VTVSHASLGAGLAIGATVGALGVLAFDTDAAPAYTTECAADAVRVFVSDAGLAAIIDPECDDDRAGLDYPSEDR
jgi:hypothetical protein